MNISSILQATDFRVKIHKILLNNTAFVYKIIAAKKICFASNSFDV